MADIANIVIKSSQEQAVASWVEFLNKCRLDELVTRLNQQDVNLEEALKELDEIKRFLGDPSHILGNPSTKHGEIAEHMQVNFSNARRAIQGLDKNHSFDGVGRTAPEDYMRNGQQVQSKFYNGLNNTIFGNHALSEHLETYPDFIKNGGSYDIPKNQYEMMVDILDKYKNNPSQLSTSEYNLAKRLDEFFKENGLELGKDINPAVVDYSDVQQGTAYKTVEKEEERIKNEDKKRRSEAYEDSTPTIKEGLKSTGISASVEGGVAFCLSVAKKRKKKRFSEFTSDDWKEIGIDTGKGTLKGGVRGGTVYVLTNFTTTSANIASAYVTAAFGVAAQAKAMEDGRISKEDFVINCETICLDVSVSAIASAAGSIIIPIPVLGAVIGNVAGAFVYELCKKQASLNSQKIISRYNEEMNILNQQADKQSLQVILEVQKALNYFSDLEKLAFSNDMNVAFTGSIRLAEEVGVEDSKILKTKNDIDKFFLE